MIYGLIENRIQHTNEPMVQRILEIDKAEAATTDSKQREAVLLSEVKALRREQHNLHYKIEGAKGEAFRELLAEEYGIPLTHPKFDALYSYAWQEGHSSGYSSVESVFMEVVDSGGRGEPGDAVNRANQVECGRRIPSGEQQDCKDTVGGFCSWRVPAAVAAYIDTIEAK